MDELELIARLEKLTKPDRELDIAIYRVACEFPIEGDWVVFPQGARGTVSHFAPRYTELIDAAMTLVPEGAYWKVGNDSQEDGPITFYASVRSARFSEHTANPAIALSIASLKAIAALKARKATS